MKKYVINLKSRADRLQLFLRNNSSKLGPGLEIFEAFDGTEISYEQLVASGFDTDKNWRDPILKRSLTKGEVGCFLSHYKLWEECSEGDEPFLIMEDDVVFNRNFEVSASYIERVDLCYLVYSEQDQRGVVVLDDHLQKPCYPYWLAAYVISPEGARKLVSTGIEKNIIPADEYVPRMMDRMTVTAFRSAPCSVISREAAGTNIEPTDESHYLRDFTTHVLTCGDSDEKAKALFESARLNGIEVKNVLNGEWKGGTMVGPGGGQKLNNLLSYIVDNEIPDHDVVLFVDAFDVFFARDLETIIGRYLGYKSEIVFSAEKELWPDGSLQFPPSHTPFRYLNSGTFIGRVGEIKRMLEKPIEDHEDDQLFLQKAFLTGRYSACLDKEGYLFQTHSEETSIQKGHIYNESTRCFGCIYHGNGGKDAKEHFQQLYKTLYPELKFAQVSDYKVIGHEMLMIDFMTPEQCRQYIEISEEHGGWNPHPDDKFPSHDIHLKELGLWEEIEAHWTNVVAPICQKYWSPYMHYHMRKAFTMKYSEDTQKTLGLHTDASLVTGSVKLNDDYVGATLEFPRQDVSNKDVPIGKMILFPGQVTHGHYVKPLISGTKYSLTIWTARYQGDYLNP